MQPSHVNRHVSQHGSTVHEGLELKNHKASEKEGVLLQPIKMLALSNHYGKAFSRRRQQTDVNWKEGLEKVLEDPVGLKTFTEFLKREFSAENIMFWMLCEHYHNQDDVKQRKKLAKEIVDHHLCHGAPEPINIDSRTRQKTIDGAEEADPDLFVSAQKQIFNLMKFDCYQRFLKSDLCEAAERLRRSQPLQENGSKSPKKSRSRSKSRDRTRLLKATKLNLNLNRDISDTANSSGSSTADENSPKSETEEKKRKSLLPWRKGRGETSETERSSSRSPVMRSRSTNFRRSKRKVAEKNLNTPESDRSSSRTPSENSDMSESFTTKILIDESRNEITDVSSDFCRIHLPDSSSAVLSPNADEKVSDVIRNLLAKRGLPETAVEAFLKDSSEAIPLCDKVSKYRGKEIIVRSRTIIRLELPSKQTIIVKADPKTTCAEILEPVLKKYGLAICDVTLHYDSTEVPVNLNCSISALDKCKITVCKKDSVKGSNIQSDSGAEKRKGTIEPSERNTMSLIFEELVRGTAGFTFDELGVLDLDKNKVKLLGLVDKEPNGVIMRRSSLKVSKEKPVSLLRYSNRSSSSYDGSDTKSQLNDKTNLNQVSSPTKGSLPRNFSQRDSYEIARIWNRLQKRLDDQRGTDLSCELPEFLRIKEPSPSQPIESDL